MIVTNKSPKDDAHDDNDDYFSDVEWSCARDPPSSPRPPLTSYSRFPPAKRIPGPRRRARPSSNPVTVVASPWSERLVAFYCYYLFFLVQLVVFFTAFSLPFLSDTFVLCFSFLVWL